MVAPDEHDGRVGGGERADAQAGSEVEHGRGGARLPPHEQREAGHGDGKQRQDLRRGPAPGVRPGPAPGSGRRGRRRDEQCRGGRCRRWTRCASPSGTIHRRGPRRQTPIGTLMKKIQGQLAYSTSTPPRTGPTAAAAVPSAPQRPTAMPCWRRGKAPRRMASEMVGRPRRRGPGRRGRRSASRCSGRGRRASEETREQWQARRGTRASGRTCRRRGPSRGRARPARGCRR